MSKPEPPNRVASSAGLDRWPGDFMAGEQVTAHGTQWHGKTGTVVTEWQSHWYRRPGLVAVFLPDFPATKFWWFAPHNLKRSNAKFCERAGGRSDV